MLKFPVDQLERFYQIQKYAELVDNFLKEFGPLDEEENLESLPAMAIDFVIEDVVEKDGSIRKDIYAVRKEDVEVPPVEVPPVVEPV